MSSEEFSPTVPASADFEELPPRQVPFASPYPPHRYWLHALLLLLTLFSTTLVGARMQWNFDHNLPFMSVEEVWNVFTGPWQRPESLLAGLPFSLTLLT
ncbi:MAG: hypothetical protein ACRD8O_17920, partial [Bryobacteraceae bacterium]